MDPYKSSNIILIIGNGFDLAHGLKTSYNDFANWFITKIETEIVTYLTTRDDTDFFNEEFLKYFTSSRYSHEIFQKNEIKRAVSSYFEDYSNSQNKNLYTILSSHNYAIKNIISNEFLGKLYANQYTNWFDIENAYFQELIRIKGSSKIVKGRTRLIKIKHLNKLNKELIEVKNYLKEYLKTIKIKKYEEINIFFKKVFDLKKRKMHNNHAYNPFVINFNYTNTIETYFKDYMNTYIPLDGYYTFKGFNINYIHGNLKQDNIIFGYGNDQHKEYQNIKDLEINEFLENFKTFEYLKNNNYSRIYNDILDNNSIDDYIVFVLGHSLGATDKTLLEEIFNNEKCKQIHLFKRRDLENDEEKLKKSFNDLVFSASRILTNEKDLRKKILNYENSEFFP